MSLKESREGPAFNFIFGETESYVKGGHNTASSLRKGIVIGSAVCVRYLGSVNKQLQIGIWEVRNGQLIGQEMVAHLGLFRRYRLYHPASSTSVKLRASAPKRDGKPTFTISIETDSRVIRADTLDITFD